MNLAWKEIRYDFVRFMIAVIGLTSVQTASIGMLGFYRGLVQDILVVIDGIGADLWIVQGGRMGPFAEPSIVPENLDRRVAGVNGVQEARRYIQYPQMFYVHGAQVRLSINAIDYPKDNGSWIPLIAGRYLYTSRYEAIVDQSTGLALGERVRLGRDDYEVVGVTQGQLDMTGSPLIFVSVRDALAIQAALPSETILLARASQQAGGISLQQPQVSAVLAKISPLADPEAVRAAIAKWPDVSVVTKEEQVSWVYNHALGKLRLQILNFVGLMLAVTGIILGLTMYASVLQKIHVIALAKIFGARDSYIASLILQYACAIGLCSLAIALVLARVIFPHFPRSVILLPVDAVLFGVALLVVCMLSSSFGIRRALQVRAQSVLG